MALIADYITAGFEPVFNKVAQQVYNPVPYELTPGVSFNRGDLVVVTNGKVALATPGAANILGVMAAPYPATLNVFGKTTKGMVYDNPFNIFCVTFTGHRDAFATGGSTTTLIDTALATATDNVWNGALLYVYAGPGAGSVRTVKTYTGATDTLTVEEPFNAAITNASQYILLGAGAAVSDGINVGQFGVNLATAATINAGGTVAAEAGPFVVTSIDPFGLTMEVLIRKHLYNR